MSYPYPPHQEWSIHSPGAIHYIYIHMHTYIYIHTSGVKYPFPGARNVCCRWLTAELIPGPALGLKELLGLMSHIFSTKGQPKSNDWLICGYKGLGSLPQYRTTPKLSMALTMALILTSQFNLALCPVLLSSLSYSYWFKEGHLLNFLHVNPYLHVSWGARLKTVGVAEISKHST